MLLSGEIGEGVRKELSRSFLIFAKFAAVEKLLSGGE